MLSTGSVIRVCGQVAVSGLHRYQARYGVGIVCYKFLIYLDWPTLASWNVRGMQCLSIPIFEIEYMSNSRNREDSR